MDRGMRLWKVMLNPLYTIRGNPREDKSKWALRYLSR
jgi:hypothetical protein